MLLSDVCLSRTSGITLEQRPRKTKICIEMQLEEKYKRNKRRDIELNNKKIKNKHALQLRRNPYNARIDQPIHKLLASVFK